MTKNKKRLLILLPLLLIICALAIVIICDRFAPAIETEEFLPKPDELICEYGGKKIKLSEEQRDALYTEFQNAMNNIRDSHTHNTDPFFALVEKFDGWIYDKNGEEPPRIEFRYKQRYAHDVGEKTEKFNRAYIVLNDHDMEIVLSTPLRRNMHGNPQYILHFYSGYYDVKELVYTYTS